MYKALGDTARRGDSETLWMELIQKAKGVLDDDLFFSTPFVDDIDSKGNISPPRFKRKHQNLMNLIGSWRV